MRLVTGCWGICDRFYSGVSGKGSMYAVWFMVIYVQFYASDKARDHKPPRYMNWFACTMIEKCLGSVVYKIIISETCMQILIGIEPNSSRQWQVGKKWASSLGQVLYIVEKSPHYLKRCQPCIVSNCSSYDTQVNSKKNSDMVAKMYWMMTQKKVINTFKYHVSCTDGKISVRIIYFYYLFFHHRPTH